MAQICIACHDEHESQYFPNGGRVRPTRDSLFGTRAPCRMTGNEQVRNESWMRLALREAEIALAEGEAPIGCVLLDGSGTVVGSGRNDMRATGIATGHAEINAFRAAGRRVTPEAGIVMVSTLEPCVMCTGAAMETGVTNVIFGLRAPADSGTGRVNPPSSPGSTSPPIVGGILASESRALFQAWLRMHEGDASRAAQRAFIEQLMALT